MTEQRKDFPEFYLTRPQPCPYLPDRYERKLFTHLGREKSSAHFDLLHGDGFRRSQTIAYRPHCENCKSCISVRIRVNDFAQSRSQKRVWRLNKDIHSARAPALASPEQYALFKSYVETRHNDGGMADMSQNDYQAMIEDSVVDSFLTEYRLPRQINSSDPQANEGQNYTYSLAGENYQRAASHNKSSPLIGIALCDELSDGVSLVYSYFDPDFKARSLGTFIILETISYAQALGLPFVYLGYWVEGSPKMDYKIRFLPQDHLIDGVWRKVSKRVL
ncbi:MAG: putative arginyl-tRNA--protein transferase [Rhodomicrobium sp.]|nr:MAG: putative arginyl-tRNA--protein transferase [Rhodomicrobium sp.]